MKYRRLGRSGLEVSVLCLGAMTFGEPDEKSMMHGIASPAKVAHDILDRAVAAGVNFVDNANIYGNDGLAETVLGDWFAASGRRDDIVLATKFRFRTKKAANGAGAARIHIMRAVEDSLRRLRTDRIDLYQIHMQDIDVPEQETLRALDDLVRQGKVLYIGASNYAAYRLCDSLWRSDARGLERFVSMQMQYNLVHREIEREHVPLAREHGLGIIPWSPLASGFLTGKYRQGAGPPAGARLERWADHYKRVDNARNWSIVEALVAVAAELDASPAQVALAWLLHKPQVSSVIFGARTVEQLNDNLPAALLALSADQVSRLDDASQFELGYPYDFIGKVQGRW